MNYHNPISNQPGEAVRIDQKSRSGEFCAIARYLVMAKGNLSLATKLSEARAVSRVTQVLKAGVSAGSTALGSGSGISEWPGLVAAFLGSLQAYGAYDAMFDSMRVVPLHARVSVVTTGVTGAVVGEMQITPISGITVAGNAMAVYKALAILVATDELMRIADPSVPNLFASELKNAVATATDQQFLNLITAGLTPIASSGSTAASVLWDIDAAASAIVVDNQSVLFLIVSPAVALKWSLRTTANGEPAFEDMTPTGGAISGIRVVVSAAVPLNSFILCDAHQIAAATGSIELDASQSAALEFQTAPASPPIQGQTIRSLWQENETGLRCLRYFSALPLRSSAVAIVNGLNYTGNSPA